MLFMDENTGGTGLAHREMVMRLRLAVAAIAALMALAPTAASGNVANPFVGSWETFDDLPDDTSHVRMQISPTGSVTLRDEFTNACEGSSATYSGNAVFDLSSDPQTFVASGDLYCHTEDDRVLLVAGLEVAAEYDVADDVLIGTAGQLTRWSRTGTGDRPACSP